MEPPSALRIRFQTMKKAVMTMLDQESAQSVAASVCSPTLRPSRLCPRPPIRWLPLRPRGRWDADGAEIGQQSGGKVGEVGHLARI